MVDVRTSVRDLRQHIRDAFERARSLGPTSMVKPKLTLSGLVESKIEKTLTQKAAPILEHLAMHPPPQHINRSMEPNTYELFQIDETADDLFDQALKLMTTADAEKRGRQRRK